MEREAGGRPEGAELLHGGAWDGRAFLFSKLGSPAGLHPAH